jgi:NAD(P)-dependent dehydrogenase (short-subunit alcohol dehydrogenase family)
VFKLFASANPRVVNVSSDGHRLSPIRLDDPGFQDGKVYDKWKAYGQSKTANILYTKALAEKLAHMQLKSFSLHPGVIFGTSLGARITDEDLKALSKWF